MTLKYKGNKNLIFHFKNIEPMKLCNFLTVESPCNEYMLCFFQPPEDVSCVAWNRQVQHILASTFGSRCVVWDLRKNEPIIKVSDSMSRVSLLFNIV